jgi:hypothetical protein
MYFCWFNNNFAYICVHKSGFLFLRNSYAAL